MQISGIFLILAGKLHNFNLSHIMKLPYLEPEVQVVFLLPRDGVLISASNEGYTVDPFNPGLSNTPFEDGFSFFGGDEIMF